jgi:undecaprenyl-diphosphatase
MGVVRTLDRWGAVARRPPVWAVLTAGLFACGGCSRRAAKRGTAYYLTGMVVGNGLKLLFKRPQPRHRFARRPYVSRSAFPSGHGAAEVAFVFGAAQEAPLLFPPIAMLAMLAHWSLVREGKHYISDMLVGGTIGLGIVGAAAKLNASRPPADQTETDE